MNVSCKCEKPSNDNSESLKPLIANMTKKFRLNYSAFFIYLLFVPFIYKGIASGQYLLSTIAIFCLIGSGFLLIKAFSGIKKERQE